MAGPDDDLDDDIEPAEIPQLVETWLAEISKEIEEPLAFDADTVAFLSDTIDELREQEDEEQLEAIVVAAGLFVGECLRREFGGTWRVEDDSFVLRVADLVDCHPVDQAMQQATEEEGEGLDLYYRVMRVLAGLSPEERERLARGELDIDEKLAAVGVTLQPREE